MIWAAANWLNCLMGSEDVCTPLPPSRGLIWQDFGQLTPSFSTPRRFQLLVKNCPESGLVLFSVLFFSESCSYRHSFSASKCGVSQKSVMSTAVHSPLRAVLSLPFRRWLREAPLQAAQGKALPEGLRAPAQTSRAKVNLLINTRHWITLRIIQGNLQNVGGRERGRIKLGGENWLALMFEKNRWGRRKRLPAPKINRGLGLPEGGSSNLIKIKPAGICSNWCKTCGQHKINVRGKKIKMKIKNWKNLLIPYTGLAASKTPQDNVVAIHLH